MSAANPIGCPSHEELVAFGLGSVGEQAFRSVADHLETCPSCAAALSTIRDSGDSLLSGLRRPVSAGQFLDEPEYRQAVERVEAIGYGGVPIVYPDDATPLPVPKELGRYEIVGQLGRGGMGTVYLARDTLLGREVALKIPHFRHSDDPRRLERFYREARAAATLDAPNLCPVYDVGEIDGVPYLSMARIRGQSLSKLLASGRRFSQREAAQIVRLIALAVDRAHAGGIVHRDIKPSNIMLSETGEPILTDFGLAQRLELEDPRLTRSGVIVGTPSYMAPEQVDGDPETLGPACDVYSLGVVLYELLTGRVPFEGPLLSVLRQLGKDQPAPPSSHRKDLDPRLEAVCVKTIAKNPANRYPSAAALAEALDEYLAGKPSVVPSRSRRRRLIRRIAAGAGLLLMAAVLISVATNRGTIEIRAFGEHVKVSVLQNGVEVAVIDTKTDDTITLHAGTYELQLADAPPGFELSSNRFFLGRSGRRAVLVRPPVSLHPPAAPPQPASDRIMGRLRAWGWNEDGQCDVPAGDNFVDIAAGLYHSVALRGDGSLVGWGRYDGVPRGNDFVDIAAGEKHSVMLKKDGSLVARGHTEDSNQFGQLNIPIGLNDVVAIEAGEFHTVALRKDGSVVAWGRNDYRQCNVYPGNNFVAIAAAGHHTLALKRDGSLAAWGLTDEGQCDVPAGRDFVRIGVGSYHSFALRTDGRWEAWGNNANEELNVPRGRYRVLTGGKLWSVGLREDGSLVAWGVENEPRCRLNVPAGNNFVAVAVGHSHGLAIEAVRRPDENSGK